MKKTFVVLIIILLQSAAQASFYQTYCSNGAGTVKVAEGHLDRTIQVSEGSWQDGNWTIKPVQLSLDEAGVRFIYTAQVNEDGSTEKTDVPPPPIGRIVTLQKVRIEKLNKSLFSEKTLHRTDDGKAVEAFVLCENAQ